MDNRTRLSLVKWWILVRTLNRYIYRYLPLIELDAVEEVPVTTNQLEN